MNHAERNADDVRCDRCRRPVQLIEDGDVQDDGTVLWSGAQRGECCGLLYAGATWHDWVDVYDLRGTETMSADECTCYLNHPDDPTADEEPCAACDAAFWANPVFIAIDDEEAQ